VVLQVKGDFKSAAYCVILRKIRNLERVVPAGAKWDIPVETI